MNKLNKLTQLADKQITKLDQKVFDLYHDAKKFNNDLLELLGKEPQPDIGASDQEPPTQSACAV